MDSIKQAPKANPNDIRKKSWGERKPSKANKFNKKSRKGATDKFGNKIDNQW